VRPTDKVTEHSDRAGFNKSTHSLRNIPIWWVWRVVLLQMAEHIHSRNVITFGPDSTRWVTNSAFQVNKNMLYGAEKGLHQWLSLMMNLYDKQCSFLHDGDRVSKMLDLCSKWMWLVTWEDFMKIVTIN
jgi:hypothetical protein